MSPVLCSAVVSVTQLHDQLHQILHVEKRLSSVKLIDLKPLFALKNVQFNVICIAADAISQLRKHRNIFPLLSGTVTYLAYCLSLITHVVEFLIMMMFCD